MRPDDRRDESVFLVLVALASGAILWSSQRELWLDELTLADQLRPDLLGSLGAVWGYYYSSWAYIPILWLVNLFCSSAFCLRIPAWLSYFIYLLVLRRQLGRQEGARFFATIVALLVAFSENALYIAGQVRPYALAQLAAFVALCDALQWLTESRRFGRVLLSGALLVLLPYLHPIYLPLTLLPVGVLLLSSYERAKKLQQIALLQLLIFFSLAPLFVRLGAAGEAASAGGVGLGVAVQSVAACVAWSVGNPWVFSLLGAISIWWLLVRRQRLSQLELLCLVFAALQFLLFVYFDWSSGEPNIQPRHCAFFVLVWSFIVGRAFSSMPFRGVLSVGVLIAVALPSLSRHLGREPEYGVSWESISRIVSTRSRSDSRVVVLSPDIPASRSCVLLDAQERWIYGAPLRWWRVPFEEVFPVSTAELHDSCRSAILKLACRDDAGAVGNGSFPSILALGVADLSLSTLEAHFRDAGCETRCEEAGRVNTSVIFECWKLKQKSSTLLR